MDDEQHGDAAAEAFEAMRGEMALLRRAVERLAAERQEVPEPIDYTDTLGHLQKGVNAATNRIDLVAQAIAKMPGLKMTPEEMAQRIGGAADVARREDQKAITSARQSFEDTTRRLERYILAARTGEQQNRWVAYTGGLGIILGALLWGVFGGAILRTTPDSWGWPESAALSILGTDDHGMGARRLVMSHNPRMWDAMMLGIGIDQENGEVVERCRDRAEKAGKSVRCTIDVGAGAI